MTIVIDAPFATAEKTAKALGVSKTRFKRLVRLVDARAFAPKRPGTYKIDHKNGTRIQSSARKRKKARGKAKKVAR